MLITQFNHSNSELNQLVSTLFEQVLNFFCSNISPNPPLGHKEYKLIDNKNGPKIFWPLKPSSYEIGLSIDKIDIPKTIYQIAHELCHIFIDPRINGVFIEIVCHKTAFDILEDLKPNYNLETQSSFDFFIERLIKNSEENKKTTINRIENLQQIIKALENEKVLLDRSYNNLISMKIKQELHNYNKYFFINFLSKAVTPIPSKSPFNLTTLPIVNTDFEKLNNLIYNELLNKRLYEAIKKLFNL